MAKLRLPLWFVYNRQPKIPAEHPPCDDPVATLAFSTTVKLVSFLEARQGGKWKISLARDAKSLLGMVADFHERSEFQVCLDPEPNGNGGEKVMLAELLEFSETLPND
jgi:hypothetical protein